MARIRGTIFAGRSGRRGRQYLQRHGKGFGRRMLTKVIDHELFPYQLPRKGTKLPMKTDVDREQMVQALKEQARAIDARLSFLDKRISELDYGVTPSAYKASVDPDRCVGCGTCQEVCPAGAISVEKIARIDQKRCISCGWCVEQCPRGAIALHPLNTGYKEQFRVAV